MSSDDEVYAQGGFCQEWQLVVTQPESWQGRNETALLKVEERGGYHGGREQDQSVWIPMNIMDLRRLRAAATECIVHIAGKVEDLQAEERLNAIAQMTANIHGTASRMRDCLERTPRSPEEIVESIKNVLEHIAENTEALLKEIERKEEG